jgi:MFS family permease
MPVFPVYALLFAQRGVSAGAISALFVLWSASSNLFEVPSGAWADTVPRRRLLLLAAAVYGCAFATWAVVPTFAGFAVGFVLWALSGALSSGTFEALAYDELAALGATDAYARTMGVGRTLSLVGMAAATLVAAPLVALGGFTLTCWVSVGVCVVQLGVVRSLPPGPPPLLEHRSGLSVWSAYVHALRCGVGEALHHSGVRTAVLASAGLAGLQAYDEYFGLLLDEDGASAVAIPLWLVTVGVTESLGGLLAERATRWSASTFRWLVPAAGATVAVGALVGHPAGILAVAAGYGVLQLTIVVADVRLQDRIESDARATVTSVSNVLAEGVALVVYAMFGLGSGWVGYDVLLALAALPLLAGARWFGWALATGDRL